jgi:hypothetical protein
MTRQPLTVVEDPALVVDDPAAVTPGWLADVLRRGSGLDVRIASLRLAQIGTGQVGASYRVKIEYEKAPDGAPDSVVIKMPFGSSDARALLSFGFASEVGFYLHLADQVRARIPHCWYAAISPDHCSFTLVLEDLFPSVPGSQEAGCDLEQARDAVCNLADLHAPFWNSAFLRAGMDWLRPMDADFAELIGASHQDATEKFIERFGAALPAEDAGTLRAAAALTTYWAIHRQEPYSLVHGDYRLDNLMFPVHGPGVAALDWQSLMVGNPGRDLAYFLACSLTVGQRREAEKELVTVYQQRLAAHGVSGYGPEDCFADYRVGVLQGPLLTVLGCVYSSAERTAAADAMFLSMTARFCQAIRDLGTLDAVRP